MTPPTPRSRPDFRIAIIGAKSNEVSAIYDVLDGSWDDSRGDYGKAEGDQNIYHFGHMSGHNVVITPMPGTGTVSASRVASSLRSSFPNIELALLVGICGGVPTVKGRDIYLGDLIISRGIINYGLGRQHPTSFRRKNSVIDEFPRPDPLRGSLLNHLETAHGRETMQHGMIASMKGLRERRRAASYPGAQHDLLYKPEYSHKHRYQPCELCETDRDCDNAYHQLCSSLECSSGSDSVQRERKMPPNTTDENPSYPVPGIHSGVIGSADTVMMSGQHRDKYAAEHNLIAFEMEGAGIWDNFPTLIVKAVSDYSDSHKSARWQEYACLVAAVGAKALLKEWSPPVSFRDHTMDQGSTSQAPDSRRTPDNDDQFSRNNAAKYLQHSLQYEGMYARGEQLSTSIIPMSSFEWVWSTAFKSWLAQESNHWFWITGKPGSGKSTLMKYLGDSSRTAKTLQKTSRNYNIVKFFFDYRAGTSTANSELGLLRMFITELCRENVKLENELVRQNQYGTLADMSLGKLTKVFCDALQRLEMHVCAFIDGLDEFGGDHASLARWLCQLQDGAEIKICFASRRESTFEAELPNCHKLIMQDHNAESIRDYYKHAATAANKKVPNADSLMTNELLEQLVRGAQGVIIWARLAVDDILNRVQEEPRLSRKRIQAILKDLPGNLEEMYDLAFSRIPENRRPEVATLLFFLTELGGSTKLGVLRGLWRFIHADDRSEPTGLDWLVETSLGSFVDIVEKPQQQNMAVAKFKNFFIKKDNSKKHSEESEVRILHNTLAPYVARSNRVQAHLPKSISQRYPDNVMTGVYADVLAAAKKELDEFSSLTVPNLPRTTTRSKDLTAPNIFPWGRSHMMDESYGIVQLRARKALVSGIKHRSQRCFEFLVQRPQWESLLPLLKESILKFPQAAHMQDDNITEESYQAWKNGLIASLFFIGYLHESSGDIYDEFKLSTKYNQWIDIRLAVEYGLPTYIQTGIRQCRAPPAEIFNELLLESVRVWWDSWAMFPSSEELYKHEQSIAWNIRELPDPTRPGQLRKLQLGRLRQTIELIVPWCTGINSNFYHFCNLSLHVRDRHRDCVPRLRELADIVYELIRLSKQLSLPPLPPASESILRSMFCDCKRKGHPMIAWLATQRSIPADYALQGSELDAVLFKLARDQDTITTQYCSKYGSACHEIIREMRSFSRDNPQNHRQLQMLIILAKLGVDPTIKHGEPDKEKTPLELLHSDASAFRYPKKPNTVYAAMAEILEFCERHGTWPDFTGYIEKFNLKHPLLRAIDPYNNINLDLYYNHFNFRRPSII